MLAQRLVDKQRLLDDANRQLQQCRAECVELARKVHFPPFGYALHRCVGVTMPAGPLSLLCS